MTTLTWTTIGPGFWNTASNWSPAQVPTTGDTVLVNQSGAYLVTMPGSVSVELASLTMANAFGELLLGGSVQTDSSLIVSAGTLDVTGSLNDVGSFTNSGTILNNGGMTLNGTLTPAEFGNISGRGGLTLNGAVNNSGGTFSPIGSGTLNLGTIFGGTMVNWTTLPNAVLDGVTWRGPMTLASSGTLAIADGITMTGSNGTGPGTITALSPTIQQQFSGLDFINTQTFDNATFIGAGNIVAGATLTIGPGATFDQLTFANPIPSTIGFSGGTILNLGTILGTSTNGATLINRSNGVLSFSAGDFENSGVISGIDQSSENVAPIIGPTGVMQISIGGTFHNRAGGIIETGASAGLAFLSVAASADFTNDGTIVTQAPSSATGGTVDIASFLAGSGTMDIGASAVTLEAGAASTQSLAFIGRGFLVVDQPNSMLATINGFAVGDQISLIGVGATGVSYTDGDLRLQIIGSQSTFDLAITGTHSLSDFLISAVGTETNISLACFAAGTRLATTRGMIAVETLRIGDAMVLARHDALPVVWLGHREVDCRRHPEPHKVWPVRIVAGAFAPDVPRRDLYLSPDHAVFGHGVLIPVKYLVNGTTITQVPMDRVTYFHVELPRHDVLLAEGLSVESLLPNSDRSGFANGGGAVALHPAWAWEGEGCAPLVVTGPEIAAVRAMLARRASKRRRAA